MALRRRFIVSNNSIYLQNFTRICRNFCVKTATMITFKAIASRYKRRDGLRAVSIRVTFRGRVRWLPTTIACSPADLTRGGNIKNADTIARCNALTDRLRSEAASLTPYDLEGRDVDWVVAFLTERMRRQDFRLDFFDWAEEFLRGKGSGNRAKYETALRAFARYLGRAEIDINDITHALLVDFAEACDRGPKMGWSPTRGVVQTSKPRTGPISPHYLAHLSHIYDGAKDRYNDEDGGAVVIPRSPFRRLNLTPPRPTTGQKALPLEVLQAMIDDTACGPCVRRSLDIFLVGFALMGANLADLWEAVPQKGPYWGYKRRKTRNRRADGAFIRCWIAPEIRPLLARLGAGSSRAWWLPVIHGLGKDASIAGHSVNVGLREWAEGRGIEPFTYYACRHSWATLARRSTEKATVDEALGHVGDYRVTDIYAERDWEQVAEAARRVVALLRWQ